jgi:hypothetical protein
MESEADETVESAILDRHPGLREFVSQSEQFAAWKRQLPSVFVDGVTYYVRGGDMLKDESQIMLEWVRRFHAERLEGDGG